MLKIIDKRNAIYENLRQIEYQNNVKVLFAAESGSRAWRFSSRDSDWDVRFIYIVKPCGNAGAHSQKDTIGMVLDDGALDISGWELRNALTLLQITNSEISDWLHSPIIYEKDEDFYQEILALEKEYYDPQKSIFHFYAIAKEHDGRYLARDGGKTLKRFLYYLRGLLACVYVEKNGAHPPILFEDLVAATIQDDEIKALIQAMLVKKRNGREYDHELVDPKLLKYCEPLDAHVGALLKTLRPAIMSYDDTPIENLYTEMANKYGK